MTTDFLAIAAAALFALGFGHLIAWLWPSSAPPSPTAGERGRNRLIALRTKRVFARVEPWIRGLGSRVASLPLGGGREGLDRALVAAGRPLGLDGNELIALSIVSSVFFAFIGFCVAAILARNYELGLLFGFAGGAALPRIQLGEHARARRMTISREFPQVLDLVAMSMQAGLDFPGALSRVTAHLRADSPLGFELEHLLHHLSLGWSRQAALEALADRIPTPQIRRFVVSVAHAEKQGTPLADVLAVQADVIRTRRFQAAEQAASRAAVLILGPLTLIFACVFTVLVGPFVIKFIRGELF